MLSSPATVTPSATAGAGTWMVEPRSKRWKEVAGPRLRARAELVDVVADGPRRAWAVGFEDGAEDREGTVVVERWNGAAWKKTALDRELYVSGFDVGGPGDIWIVGDGVAIHWDGRRWSYPRPSGLGASWFTDVSIDKGRAVLVGTDLTRDTSLALEWTGRKFEKRAAVQGVFAAVTARHDQVWVVGTALRDGCSGIRPTVWHAAQGGTYTEMPLPDVPGGYLKQVWEISPDDVWAVGGIGGEHAPSFACQTKIEGSGPSETLIMHWDGSSWQRMAVPSGDGPLESVTAFGPDDVWAVGYGSGDTTVALHFDGRTWTRERIYDYPLGRVAVTAIPGTSELWVVGAANHKADYGKDVILRRR
ncbi:hypothetical protein [Nonomuraea sp. NPDC049709]|uniref:hypothetical protein n=1 Tax=Nonomuraea sp. NPDC049709 TaxID=3154736 RepID=UPI00341BC800